MKKVELEPINQEVFFQELNKNEKNVCFLNSANEKGWTPVIGWNPIEIFRSDNNCNAEENKTAFLNFIKKNRKRKIIGYISYDFGCKLHNVNQSAKNDLNLYDIFFYSFDNYVEFTKESLNIYYTHPEFIENVKEIISRKADYKNEGDRNYYGRSKNFALETNKRKYKSAYNKIQRYIREGDIYQINLTHRLIAETGLSPRYIFSKIIKTNRVGFSAYIEGDNFEILSASPERFIKITKDRVLAKTVIETCPIKGTRPRGKTKKEDAMFKKELINSEKEKAELNMITDLLRNDLGKVCEVGSVKVVKKRELQNAGAVWHTFSKIDGIVRKKLNFVEALLSMLPGGSITGCPKKRAIEIIDELEKNNRGVYTGVIGTIDANQELDFNIAIRTIIKKGRKLYLSVGGGIVSDSEPNSEFQETLDKAGSFMRLFN